MMLKRSLKLMEYLHATLLFTMPIPLVYALAELSDPAGGGIFYLKCLLVAVPVAVTERAVKRTRNLAAYFVVSAAVLAVMGGIAVAVSRVTAGAGGLETYAVCYCIGMFAETFFIAAKRFQDRIREARREREDPLAASEPGFLNRPSISLVWYFVVFYGFGICLNAKLLCDIAFYSAIVYTFLALVYAYFGTTREYLEMNKRTRGIPKRRLYGISFSMLLIFSVLLFAGMMPAVLLSGQRQYTDIREWVGKVPPAPYKYERDMEFQPPSSSLGGAEMMIFLDDEPAPEPSKAVSAVFWVIGIVCVLAFLYGIFQAVRQVFLDFRNSRDENGDIIEEIRDDQPPVREDILSGKRHHGTESEAERIRRRYRRMIRKHRKERPAPYESPAEIEEYAGLGKDAAMQRLHREYEKVRYGEDRG